MDEERIDEVLSGNTEAFRYFISTYKNMAFNVAVSIIKDESYAEEIVQDAFMKAFGALGNFNKTAKFKTWFYRIVVNESFQRLRKLKKDTSLISSDLLDSVIQEHTPKKLDYKGRSIESAVSSLPINESLALNLFYLEESSLKEVCEITGWTISNAKVILHRARKNLRNKLKGGN